jgi:hypothetical protein
VSYLKYYLFKSNPDLNNQIGFLILVMVFMFFSFGLLFKLKWFSFKLSIIGLFFRLITLCITAYFVMHFYEQVKQDTSASFYEWIHRNHSSS